MAKNSKATVLRLVKEAWDSVQSEIRKFNASVTIKPKTFADIFVIDDKTDDGIKINIQPVVLTVPEKAGTKRKAMLYVVIKGNIVFEQSMRNDQLSTKSFATNIGYFREAKTGGEHVYGAHFDFDPSLVAHPVFHSQVGTHAFLFDEVRKYHQNLIDLQIRRDLMDGVLGNVRVPTAQMDFFAVLLQVCSDHLINEKSEKSVHSHYENLRNHCSFFRSYGTEHSGLQASINAACYRSPYWYGHTK